MDGTREITLSYGDRVRYIRQKTAGPVLGRVAPEKGFDVAIRAFRRVVDRFGDARLIVVGDGAQRSELEQLGVELDLQSSIEFRGWVDPNRIPELSMKARCSWCRRDGRRRSGW